LERAVVKVRVRPGIVAAAVDQRAVRKAAVDERFVVKTYRDAGSGLIFNSLHRCHPFPFKAGWPFAFRLL
jgi:hypothetical protein